MVKASRKTLKPRSLATGAADPTAPPEPLGEPAARPVARARDAPVAIGVDDGPARLRSAVARALAAEPAGRLRSLPFLRLAARLATVEPATPIRRGSLFDQILRDATHACSDHAVLDRLATDRNAQIRRAVAANQTAPSALLEKLAGDADAEVRGAVAGNPTAPTALLERLADDGDSWVCWMAARNPAAPTPLLERLLDRADTFVRGAVATHPGSPVTLLERLADDAEAEVRQRVAGNPATPVIWLTRLAGDADPEVRCEAAGNPSTPATLLERLAGDADPEVRLAVAGNPATPSALLARLGDDADPEVRLAVAGNPATSALSLKRLAQDTDPWVRRAAALRERRLEESADGAEAVARRMAASHVVGHTASLARPPVPAGIKARCSPAGNPTTPKALLERLASDERAGVRRRVAGNPGAPLAVLECLLQDGDDRVRSAACDALANKALIDPVPSSLTYEAPAAVRARLARYAKQFAAATEPSVARLLALFSPWVSAKALARHAGSPWWAERAAIALHPAAPPATHAKLARDENPVVRASARRAPDGV